ncbi:MAG: tetratricopeptide repeat protein, partial [Proteobacteria bacterium]|nr:tetratricopeptide repeat protein [Pseudomonadota bacterium]MBU4208128.1 tetratricopeptide repeat protein [Pseudomonadota bacterium]
MAKTSIEKRKAKRKAKQKQRKVNLSLALQKSKAEYLFQEALWLRDDGKLEKAIAYLEKALKSDPHNKDMLNEIAYLGNRTAKPD